jgi:restriction endonuclease S subunit
MKLPAYPRTKPSGVEWLGDVPEHWDVKRLRRVLAESLQYGANESAELDDPDLPRYVRITDIHENGTLRPDTFRSLPKDVAAPYLLKDGDLLFARSGATSGKTFLYQSSWGICAYAGYLIRARMNQEEAVPAFVKYFTTSTNYWQWLSSVFIQSTIQNVSAEKYADLHLSLPPPAEQRAIAAFLDRETGRVDRLVAKKRELLERLKEKRTALISRTVTRGLPPAAARAAGLPENPPLKPSGIEWLGDIPKHWESAQLRRKAHILDCKHRTVPFIDDGIPLASIREVHGFEVDLTDAKQTSEEEYLTLIEGDRRPRVGDIIYSRNATVGHDERAFVHGAGRVFDSCSETSLEVSALPVPFRAAHGAGRVSDDWFDVSAHQRRSNSCLLDLCFTPPRTSRHRRVSGLGDGKAGRAGGEGRGGGGAFAGIPHRLDHRRRHRQD